MIIGCGRRMLIMKDEVTYTRLDSRLLMLACAHLLKPDFSVFSRLGV